MYGRVYSYLKYILFREIFQQTKAISNSINV